MSLFFHQLWGSRETLNVTWRGKKDRIDSIYWRIPAGDSIVFAARTPLSLSFFLCLSISLSPFAATATPFGSRRDISSNSLLGRCILEKIRRMPFCWAYELPFFEFSSISAEYLFTHEEHLQHYYQIYTEIEVFKRLFLVNEMCIHWRELFETMRSIVEEKQVKIM